MEKTEIKVEAIVFTKEEQKYLKNSSKYVHFDWHFRDDEQDIHDLSKKIVKSGMVLILPTNEEIAILNKYLSK